MHFHQSGMNLVNNILQNGYHFVGTKHILFGLVNHSDVSKTPLPTMTEFFGTKLKNENEPQGEFEAINMEYKFDSEKYSISIYYDILWIDLNGVPHLERLPEKKWL